MRQARAHTPVGRLAGGLLSEDSLACVRLQSGQNKAQRQQQQQQQQQRQRQQQQQGLLCSKGTGREEGGKEEEEELSELPAHERRALQREQSVRSELRALEEQLVLGR